jgi:metal transporter CNNM
LTVSPERPDDDVIDNDLILVWGVQKRIITGADLLGRLLRGIVTPDAVSVAPESKDGRKDSGATVSAHPAE